MTIKLKFELSNAIIDGKEIKLEIKLNRRLSGILSSFFCLSGLNSSGNNIINILEKGNNTARNLNAIKHIKITCPDEKTASQALRLINLRKQLNHNSSGNGNKWVIFLNDINAGDDENNLSLSGNNDTIELNNDDFVGGFNAKRINIGVATNNDWNIDEDFGNFQPTWQRLEKELETILNKYSDTGNIPETSDITTDINLLNNYWIKDANSPEKKLYNFADLNPSFTWKGNEINNYKTLINLGIETLSEYKIWKEWGFNTFEEVANARANRFIISGTPTIGNGNLVEKMIDGATKNDVTEANINKIKGWIKNKKFAGVPIDIVPANGEFKPTVGQLIAFCSENWFGGKKHDNIDYPAKIHEGDPRKTRGFKPGDIGEDGKYGLLTENMSNTSFISGKKCTKIALDIWNAPSFEAAIDLAFFGKHYFVDNPSSLTNPTVRLDERYQDGSGSLLYFNEVDGWNEIETLDFYFEAFANPKCGGNGGNVYNKTTNELNTGAGWRDGDNRNYANRPSSDQKLIIDNVYKIVKSFLELYISAKTDKTKITKLEEYNISGNPVAGSVEETKKKLYEHWKGKIAKLKQNSSNKYETKRQSMLSTWTNEPYKSVLEHDYVENNTDIQVLNELEKLFKLLEGAYKTTPETKKHQLTAYSKLTNSESDSKKQIQKKLWDIIQAQRVDNSTLKWGDEAISKAKVENIEDVKKRIKEKMNKVGSDAYNTIVENNDKIKDNIENLEQVEEIFDDSKEAWEEFKANNDLFNKLNDSKNDTNKKDAWEAVNSYKKKREQDKWVNSNSTEGFATGALNHVKASLDVSKKFDDIYNGADSADKLATQLQDYINGNEFKKLDSAQQTRFKEIIKPRKIAAKRIDIKSSKSNDEQELVNLLKLDDLGTKYQDSKEGLTEVEKDLKFLNDVKGATSGDKFNARKAMGDNDDDNKNILTILISEVTEKRNSLKTKHQDSTNGQDEGGKKNESWFKNPWFISLVIFIVVFGLVAYLIKRKSSNEEENIVV